mmetsp:Transcript_44288/g.73866  ORF Transcript_44288/g.73866 Transcript_44288/m.73866 type:complete len:309 (-) Transcript_44288:221-1147(-)
MHMMHWPSQYIYLSWLRTWFVSVSQNMTAEKTHSQLAPKDGMNRKRAIYFATKQKNKKEQQQEQTLPTSFTVKMIRVGPNLMVYAANDEEMKNTKTSENSLNHITLVVRDKIVDQSQGALNKMLRSSGWNPKELFVDLPSLMKDLNNSLLKPLLGLKSAATDDNTTRGAMEVDSKGKEEEGEGNKKDKEKVTKPQGASRVERPNPFASSHAPPRPRFNPNQPSGMRPNNPRRGFNPFAPDNGMLVGPRHPGFGSGLGAIPPRRPRNPGRIPGARFDPFGPFGGGSGMTPDPDHFRAPGRRGFDEDDII